MSPRGKDFMLNSSSRMKGRAGVATYENCIFSLVVFSILFLAPNLAFSEPQFSKVKTAGTPKLVSKELKILGSERSKVAGSSAPRVSKKRIYFSAERGTALAKLNTDTHWTCNLSLFFSMEQNENAYLN